MKSIYLLAVLVILSIPVIGQEGDNGFDKKSGIYRTYEDYKAKKLNPEVVYTNTSYKINVNDYSTRPYIDIIENGKKYSFLKKDIFGVRDETGRDFRFFNNKEYLILDTGKIYIYKMVLREADKNSKSVIYFYSIKGNSKIMPLTVGNIKSSFPENPKFKDLVDLYFKSDADLTAYDDYYKTYKLNRFLFKHTK